LGFCVCIGRRVGLPGIFRNLLLSLDFLVLVLIVDTVAALVTTLTVLIFTLVFSLGRLRGFGDLLCDFILPGCVLLLLGLGLRLDV
jgi:hypothetical protein